MTNSCRNVHFSFSQLSLRVDWYGASRRLTMTPSSFIAHAAFRTSAGLDAKSSLKRMRSFGVCSSSVFNVDRRSSSGTARRS